MNTLTLSGSRSVAGGLGLVAGGCAVLVGLGPLGAAAPAHATAPAPGATAEIGGFGLEVTGNAHPNELVLRIADNRFKLVDTAPIIPGEGCLTTSAPPGGFAVSCQISRSPTTGAILAVRVDTGEGDDTFVNRAAAPVRARGGFGDDVLTGGPRGDLLSDTSGSNQLFGRGGPDALQTEFGTDEAADRLVGGGGDDDIQAGDGDDVLLGGAGDDTIRPGLGADRIDGGSGTDAAVYLENAHTSGVVVTIDNQPNDGSQPTGPGSTEGDNVLDTIEEVFGTHLRDILIGSNNDDRLEGNLGNDDLVGMRGADTINGGPGQDRLASNGFFGVPVADGSIDVLNGSSDTDTCRIPFTVVEDDATISCEVINED